MAFVSNGLPLSLCESEIKAIHGDLSIMKAKLKEDLRDHCTKFIQPKVEAWVKCKASHKKLMDVALAAEDENMSKCTGKKGH